MTPSLKGDLAAQKPNKKRRAATATQKAEIAPAFDAGEPLADVVGAEREQQQAAQQILSLHRVRVLDWEPTAVVATATSGDGTVLAAARESGAIDLYETEHWTRLTTLAGSRELALTCLAWLRDESLGGGWRLFSGGLDGSLTEWDIVGRKPKQRTDALGGAVWNMAVRPAQGVLSQVAVACDDGCLRLFRIEAGEPGLIYESSLPALTQRLLSVAWHPSGHVAVTGTSDGSVHTWDISTKQEILRLHTGTERDQTHDVWAVIVLCDGTMVTGDGGGNVQFWSAAHGSLISGYRLHAAAVLALAADPDGSRVFASGVDSQVTLFQRIEADGALPMRWEFLTSSRPHTHDVRTMSVIACPEKLPLLVTAGNDARLIACSMQSGPMAKQFRLTPVPEAPAVQFATRGANGEVRLLTTHKENADLWQLRTAVPPMPKGRPGRGEGRQLHADESPGHLVRLTTEETGSTMLASAIAPNGAMVALADTQGTHLYSIDDSGPDIKLQRLPVAAELGRSITALAFSNENQIIAANSISVYVANCGDLAQVSEIELPRSKSSPVASSEASRSNLALPVSSNGLTAALLRPSEVHLLDLQEMRHIGRIPAQEGCGPNVAAAFTPAGDTIVIGSAEDTVALYAVQSQKPVELPNDFQAALSQRLSCLPGTLQGISFLPDPQRRAAFLVAPTCFCFVDFDRPMQPINKKGAKHRSRRKRHSLAEAAGTNGRFRELGRICLACHFTAVDAAVVIEKDWQSVAANFPPPIYRHRYGT